MHTLLVAALTVLPAASPLTIDVAAGGGGTRYTTDGNNSTLGAGLLVRGGLQVSEQLRVSTELEGLSMIFSNELRIAATVDFERPWLSVGIGPVWSAAQRYERDSVASLGGTVHLAFRPFALDDAAVPGFAGFFLGVTIDVGRNLAVADSTFHASAHLGYRF